MNDHTASLEITERVVCVVTETCVLICTENVIKYYLYVKFTEIFAHNVQICVVVKISLMFAQYFDHYAITLTGGGHFSVDMV